MRASDFIARTITQRRALVWCGMAVLTIACIAILVTSLQLDTEIFNVLPGKFSSVQGLKIYDRDFEQTRELTFVLLCDPNDVDTLEEFAPVFAERLRQQPWCTRVLAGSPMSTSDGIRDLQSIAVPLLLNLEPSVFRETMSVLQPEKIRDRLNRLRQQIEAGSPRPEFELSFDPLGLIAPALKPFAESTIIEQEQPLTSPDRTMRIFLAVTNQQSISAFECQRLMREVNKFRAIAAEGWNGGRLQVLVTGRSAFVSEISLSMRYDVLATLLGSVLLVGTIFFVGFRRWLPLLGMALCLLLSCLVALTVGQIFFGRLSMISVGFCAILVGLGVDFAILIIGRYHQARSDGQPHRQAIATSIAKLGRAVFFGALTTAVGFLALVLSGSMAFSQLGMLIAIGIFVAGLFMCSILFLFVRERQATIRHDWLFESVRKYVLWILRKPVPMLIFSSSLLLVLTALGFSPIPALHFEASARSLQPKNIRASQALETIMHKMPVRWEPVLAIVRSANPEDLHDYWQKIVAHWRELQTAGKIKAFSTPAALCLSPNWMQTNRRQLSAINFSAAREALEQTLDAEGFSRDSFAPAFALLDDLQHLTSPSVLLPNWRAQLPKSSSWWFLVDRYFGHNPALTTGFVTTNRPVSTHTQSKDLERDLRVTGVPMILSGWSYALADLLPWSHHQLLIISALMAIFDISLLALLYRNLRLWMIQVITLAFGIGAMIASMKLLHINLNLLNVLSFRLVLAIGVDYGIYVVLVWQKTREIEHDVAGVVKPVLLAGLTAVSGFGSLALAQNPALTGLGIACAIGIFWSLIATIFFALPAMAATRPKTLQASHADVRGSANTFRPVKRC
ncbi:MAG TPA: MMPL family transporter [Candidatus Udaeobacter sp.]|nr:MMPL family transporter [Candidatus Udaeobacter sp.]